MSSFARGNTGGVIILAGDDVSSARPRARTAMSGPVRTPRDPTRSSSRARRAPAPRKHQDRCYGYARARSRAPRRGVGDELAVWRPDRGARILSGWVAEDIGRWWCCQVFLDRRSERAVLERLLDAVRVGESRALVVHGEPGVGKTALLEYLVGQVPGCRVVRVTGVRSEMELAFAGLHQLCAPILHRFESLPGPQRDALGTALGLSSGNPGWLPGRSGRARPGSRSGAGAATHLCSG
jgi:hypothetical protein